jgi:branched-chain amino acid transport system substrate-binding protein
MHQHQKVRSERRGPSAVLALSALLAVSLLGSSCQRSSSTEPVPAEREVLLGGLFSLTGNWSTLGNTGKAAFELAIEDVNTYLAGNAAGIRFVAAIEDTRLDPDVALSKAQALRARGVQLLIGPQSSAEVERVKPYVDANGMLLVSPSSTAGSLAIVGDNVFRFTPSDSLEGVAIASMMWDDGMRAVIPVWRDDAGNDGLEKATRVAFTALGGTMLSGIKYAAEITDLSATAAALSAQVRTAAAEYPGKVGVYLAAFDLDAVSLFAAACSDVVLGSAHWYGSDGVARADGLLANAEAAEFAARVGYPNPVFGLDEGARDVWQPLVARIRARANTEPDAFALAVYVGVWVVARGFVASGATLSIEELKRAFATAASTGFGATGWTVLNAAGDRKYGDFDFWGVRLVAGKPAWSRVARYETRTARVVR